MNATEIQKNIFQENKPKNKEEKKSTFLKLKKTREKSKTKINPLKSKNMLKKKFIKIKKKQEIKNSISDDISLDTNSTLISLEEESNINNSDMLQYIDEIELVLKDIYSKGIYFKNLNNFIKNENGQFKEKNVNVKFLTENLKNWINPLSNSEKINVILDIDETLVYSKIVKELQKDEDINQIIENLQKNEKEDIYYIKLESSDRTFIFKVHVRRNMTDFFKALNPYCNFYINTMASPLYTNKVVNILCENYGLKLSSTNEKSIIFTSSVNKKYIPQDISKNENYLILDDNICAWDLKYISHIIPIRKFHSDNNEIKNIFYQYYLFSNKVYCLDETKRPFLSKDDKLPYCVENLKNEKSQLYHITEIFLKSFLLSKILEIPISHALHFFQNIILKDYYIYYDGYDTNFVFDLIILLGGSITNDKNIATHVIYNKNSLDDNKNEMNYEGKFALDVKWIFDCFFNFKKCNEYNSDYHF